MRLIWQAFQGSALWHGVVPHRSLHDGCGGRPRMVGAVRKVAPEPCPACVYHGEAQPNGGAPSPEPASPSPGWALALPALAVIGLSTVTLGLYFGWSPRFWAFLRIVQHTHQRGLGPCTDDPSSHQPAQDADPERGAVHRDAHPVHAGTRQAFHRSGALLRVVPGWTNWSSKLREAR